MIVPLVYVLSNQTCVYLRIQCFVSYLEQEPLFTVHLHITINMMQKSFLGMFKMVQEDSLINIIISFTC